MVLMFQLRSEVTVCRDDLILSPILSNDLMALVILFYSWLSGSAYELVIISFMCIEVWYGIVLHCS